jgi:hypothetical protein
MQLKRLIQSAVAGKSRRRHDTKRLFLRGTSGKMGETKSYRQEIPDAVDVRHVPDRKKLTCRTEPVNRKLIVVTVHPRLPAVCISPQAWLTTHRQR